MTIKQAVRIANGNLKVKDQNILTNMPENVVSTSASTTGPVDGVFLGATFDHDSSSHVVSLGTLRNTKFFACFRIMLWWMSQMMGDKGRDIPMQTQFLLVKTKDKSDSTVGDDETKTVYTVFLPLLEGPFKACLQGNDRDELELCLESGDTNTVASTFNHLVYISSGVDPFLTIHEAMKVVKSHLGSFRLRAEKKLPGIVDYFGWCTWDAFYEKVTQEGVEAGLQSLTAGGAPPKFLIIDDGWQSVASDDRKNQQQDQEKEQQPPKLLRLTGIKENEKFQKKNPAVGIENIISKAKEKYGVKYVYIWQAIVGYWGGVKPGVKEMEHYESALQYPKICKGIMDHERGWKTDPIALEGVGLVNPQSVHKFFNEQHSYLSSAGADGVKVDAQSILETVGEGLGGGVEVTKQYHQALDASVARHFPDNGCIACMSHNLESLYSSKQTAIVRASDDFFPRKPVSHTIHIAAVAYNSVFLGEIMLPDWDMFQSLHPAAEYHGSARAISGGPVYISDAPGKHDFDLLKKLVLPDGSILRACLPGRPTIDCLFSDPARDDATLLKIWNMNKYTGVLGVYNCQGAAWNTVERKTTFHPTNSELLTGNIRGCDVHLITDIAPDSNWDGNVVLYSFKGSDLKILPNNASLPISLKILEHEIFTITPVKTFTDATKFAPLGLIDMFNSGGAIEGLKYDFKGTDHDEQAAGTVGVVSIDVMGCGRFGVYSSIKPKKYTVGSTPVEFEYDLTTGLVIVNLAGMPPEGEKVHRVEIEL